MFYKIFRHIIFRKFFCLSQHVKFRFFLLWKIEMWIIDEKRNQYLMRWWRSNVPFAFFLLFFSHGILHSQFQILQKAFSHSFFHPFSSSIFTFQFSEKRWRPNVNSRPAQTPAAPRRNVWATPFFGKLIYNTFLILLFRQLDLVGTTTLSKQLSRNLSNLNCV